MPHRIAIIAALEREVAPLIRDWNSRVLRSAGRNYRLFENGNTFLICGGIGGEAARAATEAIIREVSPSRLVSVGFAGALDPALKIGEVVEPATVINANDGVHTQTGCGKEVLVSFSGVVGVEQKRKLREAYAAALVDMEAAAVAQGAAARDIEFGALKVVSDDAEFAMPDVARFITREASFRQGAFALHVAIRPWLWKMTIALARNSGRASQALCRAISDYLKREQVQSAGQTL
jgi:adenosylhomocysteine nucleosidase